MSQSAECTKVRFYSKAAAKRRIKEIRYRNGNRCRHVYECPTCGPGIWHMTSQRATPSRDPMRDQRAA